MSYSKPRDSTARERVYDAIKYAKASSHKGLTVKDIADMEMVGPNGTGSSGAGGTAQPSGSAGGGMADAGSLKSPLDRCGLNWYNSLGWGVGPQPVKGDAT